MSRSIHLWIIRTEKKTKRSLGWGRSHFYFAKRTSLKNPYFLTDLHWHVKLFESKADAEEYYFAKVRAGFDVSDCSVRRLKFWVTKNKWDYWKNREVIRR